MAATEAARNPQALSHSRIAIGTVSFSNRSPLRLSRSLASQSITQRTAQNGAINNSQTTQSLMRHSMHQSSDDELPRFETLRYLVRGAEPGQQAGPGFRIAPDSACRRNDRVRSVAPGPGPAFVSAEALGPERSKHLDCQA